MDLSCVLVEIDEHMVNLYLGIYAKHLYSSFKMINYLGLH
jgi:hypothetical protein